MTSPPGCRPASGGVTAVRSVRGLAVGALDGDQFPDRRRLAVGVELVELREYEPGADRPETLLTDRQLGVLDAALSVGYYEEPRRGTQADVAEAVGLAPATVGEHLRRVEEMVLRSLRE